MLVVLFNNGLLINYGKGKFYFTFPVAYTSYYSAVAMLIDNAENYSCRLEYDSTLTQAHIHEGGSVNNFCIIIIGF